ncbi:MerR family transcriptional regulator [Streptomyces sp. R302]|uniref:MerR family transcriptional regulator n=1 Tax=unclassified Streptomyces TaxID=2593676 RepID=UPI00145E466F|nr:MULTISPECIES: MerR family transcriptional regulator [unclassified Streptomyces]NML54110.1 MerR family transcriptional regulator [Streptomyces sp. R301]NML83370.1 MerR family transcriptional regulator [Streptomyces sp. R302]
MTTAILPGVSRFSIGALARAGGVSVDAIRFYEREGLLPAVERTAGDHRRYPPEALDRLDFIRVGQRLGLRLEEIKELADACEQVPDCPVTHAVEVLRGRITAVERQVEELTGLRDRLVRVVERMESHRDGDDFTTGGLVPLPGTEDAR